MRRVVVTGAGVISPLGDSPAALGLAHARGWDGHCCAVVFGGAEA